MVDSVTMTRGDRQDQPSLFSNAERASTAPASTTPSSKAPALVPPRTAAETEELERLKEILERSGDYRVLRRSGTSRLLTAADPMPATGVRRGVYLDVETTGLDINDPIIELGMVVFEFDERGFVLRIVEEYDEFEDPGRQLPSGIVELTGITDEMVRGRAIDDRHVEQVMENVDLVIAHNAGFDRPIVEKRFPLFKHLAWGCSVVDVDWQRAGVRTRKLEYLAMTRGFFYDSHRAINDCVAGIELLAAPLTSDAEQTALASLLANSGRESVRLWAERSPFESKDLLKERRYRWNAAAKLWWRDLPDHEHETELEWLAASVYQNLRPLPYYSFDARSRYSKRLPVAPAQDATRR